LLQVGQLILLGRNALSKQYFRLHCRNIGFGSMEDIVIFTTVQASVLFCPICSGCRVFIAGVDGGLDPDGGTRWFYGECDMEALSLERKHLAT